MPTTPPPPLNPSIYPVISAPPGMKSAHVIAVVVVFFVLVLVLVLLGFVVVLVVFLAAILTFGVAASTVLLVVSPGFALLGHPIASWASEAAAAYPAR